MRNPRVIEKGNNQLKMRRKLLYTLIHQIVIFLALILFCYQIFKSYTDLKEVGVYSNFIEYIKTIGILGYIFFSIVILGLIGSFSKHYIGWMLVLNTYYFFFIFTIISTFIQFPYQIFIFLLVVLILIIFLNKSITLENFRVQKKHRLIFNLSIIAFNLVFLLSIHELIINHFLFYI